MRYIAHPGQLHVDMMIARALAVNWLVRAGGGVADKNKRSGIMA